MSKGEGRGAVKGPDLRETLHTLYILGTCSRHWDGFSCGFDESRMKDKPCMCV